MNRREFLELAALPLAQFVDRRDLRQSPGVVIASDGRRADGIERSAERGRSEANAPVVEVPPRHVS